VPPSACCHDHLCSCSSFSWLHAKLVQGPLAAAATALKKKKKKSEERRRPGRMAFPDEHVAGMLSLLLVSFA
jgi:hypothetical protein